MLESGSEFRHLHGGHKGLFLALRYVFILAASYLLIFQSSHQMIGPMQAVMIAAALASNVGLSFMSERTLFSWYVEAPVLVTDTLWVSWALNSTGSVGGEFFLLYFLVLFLAAVGESVIMVVLGTTLVTGANLYFMREQSWLSSPVLLRIVFFFTVALFYGHVLSRIKSERQRGDQGLAWARELEAKVAERTQELKRLYEESLGASRAKSDFVASMSHELRTPLHIIMGYAEMLLDPERAGESHQRQRLAERILGASQVLLKLVDGVLDLGKIESGRVQVTARPVPMDRYVLQLQGQDRLPTASGVALNWKVGSDLPIVETDPDLLDVVLSNLITNAIKFTRDGAITVAIRDVRALGAIEFRIEDTGPGIDQAQLERIFEPFQQAGTTDGQGLRGVGLGLAIVRGYAALLHADVQVQSVLGKGTCFIVRVPHRFGERSQPPANAAAAARTPRAA